MGSRAREPRECCLYHAETHFWRSALRHKPHPPTNSLPVTSCVPCVHTHGIKTQILPRARAQACTYVCHPIYRAHLIESEQRAPADRMFDAGFCARYHQIRVRAASACVQSNTVFDLNCAYLYNFAVCGAMSENNFRRPQPYIPSTAHTHKHLASVVVVGRFAHFARNHIA